MCKHWKKIEELFVSNGIDFNKFKEDEQNYLKDIYDEEKFKNIFEILKRNNMTSQDISYLLPHQANMRIISATGEELEKKKKKVLVNIEKYGNTTSATIPMLMFENQHKFKKGDNLILTAFGAGFTWGAVLVKWAI